MPDPHLTARLEAYAVEELDADLVGVANIERFARAPARMSPQGLLPSARSVIVLALHHPDAAIELGGRDHPQEIGPYRIQYHLNQRLEEMAYRVALLLERLGFQAVPIAASNIWRYEGYKDLAEHFAPDLSHRYAAVAAGLADLGYSALAITPEYGARQRFISVITDAALVPTPLLAPGSVCDNCRLCVEHCPSKALSKELGQTAVVQIEDNRYTFVEKNLWRCSWGEHFDLDLDLPIPDRVDKQVLIEANRRHGRRGGEMGCCLRYCLPKELRLWDRAYTNAPRRRRSVAAADVPPGRDLQQRLRAAALRRGVDFVAVTTAARWRRRGVDIRQFLPEAQTAVTLGVHFGRPGEDDPSGPVRQYLLHTAAYDVVRRLERCGYAALSETLLPEATAAAMLTGVLPGRTVETATLLTSARLAATPDELPLPAARRAGPAELAADLKDLLLADGADLVGVAPAERLANLQAQLAPIFDGEELLVARDRAHFAEPYRAEIARVVRRVRTPADYVPAARSVIVAALRLPRATVDRAGRPPAEAVGPLAYAQYMAVRLLGLLAFRAVRLLEDRGFRAAITFDLCGTGSFTGSPRGEQPDAFSNRFAAVAAGLARLGRGGFALTPQFGPNVRFVAVVTDADVAADPPGAAAGAVEACRDCERCLAACDAAAFRAEVAVALDGRTERFHPLRTPRCDWSKRYSLNGDEGPNYLGWDLKVPVPDEIDEHSLAEALRRQPLVKRNHPCSFAACVLACPLARRQD